MHTPLPSDCEVLCGWAWIGRYGQDSMQESPASSLCCSLRALTAQRFQLRQAFLKYSSHVSYQRYCWSSFTFRRMFAPAEAVTTAVLHSTMMHKYS